MTPAELNAWLNEYGWIPFLVLIGVCLAAAAIEKWTE